MGKTTCAVNLGAALSALGKRVLLVDMDPQANLSLHVGIDIHRIQESTYSVLCSGTPVRAAVIADVLPGLWVLPANIDLSGAEIELSMLFADVRGCSHLTELLLSLPTGAVQTAATFRRDNEDTGEKPFQLDRCHALETSGDAVRKYYPKWYRQPGKP